MKCYYQVLEVDDDADDTQIKTSYRRLALRWHPDKNIENSEEAKVKFQLIQQAYEVLSDKHERAWYDRHKDQILRGQQSEYADKSLDVYQYFSASCYNGFGDDVGGFYHVYRDIFYQIATEDLEFMDDEKEFDRIPMFGDSQSDYEKVVGPFYGYWQSYSTKKTYSWLYPDDISNIRDRYVLRKIDKKIKKIAQKAKKDRNEEIHALVGFVRKRDKRLHQYKLLLEEKAQQNRIKQDQRRLEQMRKNRLEVEMDKSTVFNVDGYEERLRRMEKKYASSNEDGDDSDVSDVVSGAEDLNDDEADEEKYIDNLYCVVCSKSFKNESSFKNHETSKKHLSNIERLKREMLEEDAKYKVSSDTDSNSEEKERVETVKKGKKSKKKNRVIVQSDPEAEVHVKEENENEIEVANKKEEEKMETVEKPRKSAKAKRLKKIEQANVPKSTAESPVDENVDTSHTCVTCKSEFDSKNKLFAHLKNTKHGVYIPKETPAPTTSNSKKGKRK